VWAYSRSLAQVHRPNHRALSLPLHYNPAERILVSAWVSGPFLSDILDERKPDLLREAARLAAEVHRPPLTPERLTAAGKPLAEGWPARWARGGARGPEAAAMVEPVLPLLQQGAAGLERAEPTLVHGDLSPGQYVWTGERLVLLDLDSFGYTDPAYDVGHFLA